MLWRASYVRALYSRCVVTPTLVQAPRGAACVRWSSNAGGGEEERGGKRGGEGGGGRGEQKRMGFVYNFLSNLRKGMERNREMQKSLKGLEEERTRMKQLYIVKVARERLVAALQTKWEAGARGANTVGRGWREMRGKLSQNIGDASESELAKKTSKLAGQAQETMDKVSEHAEKLSKTDVGQAVQKSATAVKEELLDDIVKDSAPYQPPDKIQTRSELSASKASQRSASEDVLEPNEEVREVVVAMLPRWKQRWQKLRESNPLANMFYNLRMKYDESDNVLVRGSRVVTDRVGEVFGSVLDQSDMALALAEIQKVDRTFDKEKFVRHCRFDIIPTVLEAYVRGDLEVLKDWCHEAAFNVMATVIKQRQEPGLRVDCKILEVRDADIVMAKLMDPGPVLVLSFQAQQLTLKSRDKEVEQELLENVYYVWALCRDQSQYDPITAWKVLEFGIVAAGKMLV